MKVLLDTHAFLWFVMGDARLSAAARAVIENPGDQKLISLASAWEIAIKASAGKLTLAEPFDVLVPREVRRNGFEWMPIDFGHIAESARMPFHHRDPFDRLLVAQSRVEGLPVVGVDPSFDSYGVHRIW